VELTLVLRPQHTSEIAAGLRSVTQENDLDEFLTTAQLAETDFAAGESSTLGGREEDEEGGIPKLTCGTAC
jgi:hypothetical protein